MNRLAKEWLAAKCSWCQQEFAREPWLREILWPLGIPASEKCPDGRSKLQFVDLTSCKTCCNESQNCRDCRYWGQRYPKVSAAASCSDDIQSRNAGVAPSIQINGRFSSAGYLFSQRSSKAFKGLLYDLVIPIPFS